MATMNFNTANQTYRQLLGNGLLYTIPRFQRDYSWTDVEWDDLWMDIMNVLEENNEDSHYMGYLVLQSRDSKNFDVIDGQQRLTTLSIIILAVLSNLQKIINEGIDADRNKQRQDQLRNSFIGFLDPVTLIPKSKLTLNRNNDFLFQTYLVTLQPAPKRNLKATEHLLRKSYDWFFSKIQETFGKEKDGAKLAQFVDRLADILFFTVITVSNELNAYKVFETLNARGVKLSSTDLLKNYLFSVVHKQFGDDHEMLELENRWERLIGKMGSESFPDFLRTHWNSRNKFVRHSELFKRIRDQITDRQGVFKLLRDMEADADTFAALTNPEDPLWIANQRQFITELRMFGVSQLFPLLLAGHRQFSDNDFSTLLKVCSIISFRYNVIGGLATNEQERVYNSVSEKLANKTINSIVETIQELRSIYINDETFKAAFSEKQLKTTQTRNKRIVRYILFNIEKQTSGHEFDFDSDLYNIEHILPENPGEGWEYISDRDHEQLVFRLGNMTPLSTSQNRSLGNSSFEIKRPILESSEFVITSRIAQENQTWSAERIAVRQRWLANQAVGIWKVNQLSQ
jgi:uncharacterized protein with ParB-like and HNH nuclease domain